MPVYFQKPENALKRANEFLEVDKKEAAIEILADIMKSRKHRTWQKVHEEIMYKFARLCVELKKTILFKEVIHQYKNIALQVNTKTLEDVVRYYLDCAEEQTDKAKAEAKEGTCDIEDLDVIETPESLMLSAVSGEDAQDRKDRTILTPWLKFVWESYRQCLDLLRTSCRLERLYHDVAQMAFRFCVRFNRRTELRKLCDILRNHLNRFQQQMSGSTPLASTAVNLASPDTQALHMETRFHQLDSAMNLELYMEAFRAVEDIWSLMSLSKKPPKASVQANYFTKASLVFWKSESFMFHAAALHKLFHLNRDLKKTLQPEELRLLASRVMCATLAIPLPHTRERSESLLEPFSISGNPGEMAVSKQKILANLLGLNIPPTRASLIRELEKHGVHELVYPELRQLFQDMQIRFHPLTLAKKVDLAFKFIESNEELSQYKKPLESVAMSRVVLQVSQVYETIKTDKLLCLCPFAGSAARLERLMTDLTRNLELSVRFDHRNDCIRFGLYSERPTSGSGGIAALTDDGFLPQQSLANQLVALGNALSKVTDVMDDLGIAVTDDKTKKNDTRSRIVRSYQQTCQQTHSRMLQRREMIEKRKETWEKLAEQKLQEEEEKKKSELDRQVKLETERLQKEHEERERTRRLEQTADLERKLRRERIEELRKTELGARALQNVDESELDSLDADKLMEMQREQLEKERRELIERVRASEKKMDFQVRAMRQAELPLLKTQYDEESKVMREDFEHHERERVKKAEMEHTQRVVQCKRLERMKVDVDEWKKIIYDSQKKEFDEKMSAWEQQRDEERDRILVSRKEKRKEERRAEYIERKRAMRRAKKEEAEMKKREEEERRMAEEREKKEREYAQHKAKLDAQEEMRRRREEEIEAKRIRDKDSTAVGPWRPTPNEGGWRARERARNDSWSAQPVDRSDEAKEEGPWRASLRRGDPDDRDTQENDSSKRGTDRDFSRRDFGDRDRGMKRDFGDRDGPRRDFGDRDGPRRDFGDRDGPRRDFGDRDGPRRDFGDRDGPRRDFGDRDGPRRDFGDRDGPRRDFGDRDGPRRDFGDRDGPRRDFGDRDGSRRDVGDRDGPRRDFGDRDGPRRDFGDRDGPRRDFGDRDGPRRDFGDRDGPRRDFGDRSGGGFRRDFGDRDDRGGYRRDMRDDRRSSGMRRDFDRDDRGGGMRRDFGDRDDRGGMRRDGDRGGMRRDFGDREDRDRGFGRDGGGFRRDFGDRDRGGGRDGGFRRDGEGSSRWGRRDEDGERGGFRRDDGGRDFRRDDDRGERHFRDNRAPDRSENEWRRGETSSKKQAQVTDDDGWTEVRRH